MAATHVPPIPAEVRLATHYTIEPGSDGCWLWTGALSTQAGYPAFCDDTGNFVYAHRFMYEQTFGPIPEGWHIHHGCHDRLCVNPAHLEALPPEEHRARHGAENRRRRITLGSYWQYLRQAGKSARQIASVVGVSARTVRSYIREAEAA